MEVSGQLHAVVALSPGKNPSAHAIGAWVGRSAGVDVLGKKRMNTEVLSSF
jgi:hypothetical protein